MNQVEELDKLVLQTENRDLQAALRTTQSVDEAEINRLWRLVGKLFNIIALSSIATYSPYLTALSSAEELEVQLAIAQRLKGTILQTEDDKLPRDVVTLRKQLKEARKDTQAAHIKAKAAEKKAKDALGKLYPVTAELKNALIAQKESSAEEAAHLKQIEELQLEVATLRARSAASQITIKKLQEQLQISSAQLAQQPITVSGGSSQAVAGNLQKMLEDMRQEIKCSIRDEVRQSMTVQHRSSEMHATQVRPEVQPMQQFAQGHPRPMMSAASPPPLPLAQPYWQQTQPAPPNVHPPPPWLAGRAIQNPGKVPQPEEGTTIVQPERGGGDGVRTRRAAERKQDDKDHKRARK